ncbi:carboxymuconolactone decarboxylase family protein [Lysinibacillus sphaericus]|uniref:Carboxymuconolactone decarboxylase family protein n=2 Tax=Lysinibacillus TaxID=400634 RepID=A0ABY2TB73_9BACI|nr:MULTISPECIES: carboxymuconolactone decarboxylase family protein [Lysinibacillus]AHN22264.1 4-carboxymuconolactone decarboxylase [Lysinibacillus varians]MCS1381357.1 carboxymuconolactone decarboxylase family protein [Lysinibacillus sphaericus]TKI50380.1 carboxymuconolactone decarboxylase family protein [Lysinibacillus tabacifolii]TKI65218.1 carboxymuconolactone decarboxylase family protein [Lysinibacillus varians]UDK97359.1 carboxymuconolactone decarboxylase family protein [Lysinibacillus sp
MTDRFTKGLETMKHYVTEEEVYRMVESDALADIAPDLRKMIIEFAYGDVYSRPGLDAKSRALVVITAVVTQSAVPQTKTHITRGLHAGLTPTEIVEALLQLVPYIGFPRVQNALTIAQQVFAEKQLTVKK